MTNPYQSTDAVPLPMPATAVHPLIVLVFAAVAVVVHITILWVGIMAANSTYVCISVCSLAWIVGYPSVSMAMHIWRRPRS